MKTIAAMIAAGLTGAYLADRANRKEICSLRSAASNAWRELDDESLARIEAESSLSTYLDHDLQGLLS